MTKNKSRPFIMLLTGVLWVNFAHAQESFNTSGGNATGGGGSVAYSIGQVAYTYHEGSTGSQAQEVQHAFEIFTVSVTETALNISMTAFPNPTESNLTLQISNYNNEKL